MIRVINLNEQAIVVFKHNVNFFMRYGIKSLFIYILILALKYLFMKKKMSYIQKKTWFISSIIVVFLTLTVPYILSLIFLVMG